MSRTVLRAGGSCVAALLLLALAAPALAHETRATGEVEAVVGWHTEPAYAGFPNAVEITLRDAGSGEPIVDVPADALGVVVSFGDQQTSPLPLEPAFRVGAFGTPGQYTADLTPTRAGEYTFAFSGTIAGEPYEETFTSGEGTFGSPVNIGEIAFPIQDPSAGELAASIEELRSQVGDGDGTAAGSSTTGVLGIVLGGLALIVAIAAFAKKAKA